MFYYEVIVSDASYQGKKALTYGSERKLAVGEVVRVPLKRDLVLGLISRHAPRPTFATKAIETVFDLPPLPGQLLELAAWLAAYYPAGLGSIGQQFLPRALPRLFSFASDEPRSSLESLEPSVSLPPLTAEQQNVLAHINKPDTYTLHGETGSGKTRVYIELARRTLEDNRSVIVLTPEIALTPQLERNFHNAFGDHVIVTHSKLTESERRKIWLQTLTSHTPLLIIGPRSALFSPLKDVGLIVIDESHEPSYKQEQSPHYDTGKVAAKLASLHQATLVLGSATPAIADYFLATQKQKPVLRMHQLARANSYQPPNIQIVNLRDRAHFTKEPHLSDELLAAIEKSLQAGEQSLLFLNRRGTARVVLCEQCGWQAMCEHCDLPLTYHADSHTMRCHTCGRVQPAVNSCPVCHNPNIVLKSIGTKAIVDEVTAVFPQAKIQRFDTDNKRAERIEQHYDAIRSGKVDILIGTQILAKGLDLPKLSVVGVIVADTSLYFPDYTADERTYQLLRQVIGRVGRGHRNSRVIIQTYDRDNFVVQAAAQNHWDAFYQRELSMREKFLFPPYCYMLKLTCRRASSNAAHQKAEKLIAIIKNAGLRVRVDGPSPSAHEKIGSKYQWQLVLKTKQRTELLKIVELLPSGWSYNIDPLNLL
ncbi:MAG TPA: primosomal protein N' [Candidatus Saccharimonadales bacterium]|jgi:primosomal protein N' (replication factor Y)